MAKVLIAMSGGVDSSVCAWLLKQQGYDCVGATMQLYDNETAGLAREKTCCSLEDVEDARSVAYRIGIPYYVFNYKDAFRREVIERFVRTYEAGDTPNPCIDCNRFMKFDALFLRAKELGCDYIATGHYAQIEKRESDGRYLLKKGPDPVKDQSYVLYSLTQEQLAHTLFPLGSLTKEEVRRIAQEQGFVNAKKRDSQDICFVPDGDYASFIRNFTQKEYPEGNFVDRDGNVLGRHKGIIHYTIGQRRGLGIPAAERLYVLSKNMADNTITLGQKEDQLCTGFYLDDLNLIETDHLKEPLSTTVSIRYHQKPQPALLTQLTETTAYVRLEEPQRGIAAGQAAVFYKEDLCLGGGTIRMGDEPA